MKLCVYGATGFTGTLISTLAHDDPEVTLTIAGRNETTLKELSNKLGDVEYRVARVDDAFKIQQALEGHDVVINCAGPFTDIGPVVAHVASEVGAHYLDTTGEQGYIARVRDEVNPTVGLMPATAFEYAVGDCVAAIAASTGEKTINLMYRVASGNTSIGTKKSILRALKTPGISFENNKERMVKTGYKTFVGHLDGEERTGVWFPGGEMLSVPTHSDVHTVRTFMVMGSTQAAMIKTFRSAVPVLVGLFESFLDRRFEKQQLDPHDTGGESDPWTVAAFDEHGNLLVSARGQGGYAVTARLAMRAAKLATLKTPKGYTSVAALCDPKTFLESLGIDVTIHLNEETT